MKNEEIINGLFGCLDISDGITLEYISIEILIAFCVIKSKHSEHISINICVDQFFSYLSSVFEDFSESALIKIWLAYRYYPEIIKIFIKEFNTEEEAGDISSIASEVISILIEKLEYRQHNKTLEQYYQDHPIYEFRANRLNDIDFPALKLSQNSYSICMALKLKKTTGLNTDILSLLTTSNESMSSGIKISIMYKGSNQRKSLRSFLDQESTSSKSLVDCFELQIETKTSGDKFWRGANIDISRHIKWDETFCLSIVHKYVEKTAFGYIKKFGLDMANGKSASQVSNVQIFINNRKVENKVATLTSSAYVHRFSLPFPETDAPLCNNYFSKDSSSGLTLSYFAIFPSALKLEETANVFKTNLFNVAFIRSCNALNEYNLNDEMFASWSSENHLTLDRVALKNRVLVKHYFIEWIKENGIILTKRVKAKLFKYETIMKDYMKQQTIYVESIKSDVHLTRVVESFCSEQQSRYSENSVLPVIESIFCDPESKIKASSVTKKVLVCSGNKENYIYQTKSIFCPRDDHNELLQVKFYFDKYQSARNSQLKMYLIDDFNWLLQALFSNVSQEKSLQLSPIIPILMQKTDFKQLIGQPGCLKSSPLFNQKSVCELIGCLSLSALRNLPNHFVPNLCLLVMKLPSYFITQEFINIIFALCCPLSNESVFDEDFHIKISLMRNIYFTSKPWISSNLVEYWITKIISLCIESPVAVRICFGLQKFIDLISEFTQNSHVRSLFIGLTVTIFGFPKADAFLNENMKLLTLVEIKCLLGYISNNRNAYLTSLILELFCCLIIPLQENKCLSFCALKDFFVTKTEFINVAEEFEFFQNLTVSLVQADRFYNQLESIGGIAILLGFGVRFKETVKSKGNAIIPSQYSDSCGLVAEVNGKTRVWLLHLILMTFKLNSKISLNKKAIVMERQLGILLRSLFRFDFPQETKYRANAMLNSIGSSKASVSSHHLIVYNVSLGEFYLVTSLLLGIPLRVIQNIDILLEDSLKIIRKKCSAILEEVRANKLDLDILLVVYYRYLFSLKSQKNLSQCKLKEYIICVVLLVSFIDNFAGDKSIFYLSQDLLKTSYAFILDPRYFSFVQVSGAQNKLEWQFTTACHILFSKLLCYSTNTSVKHSMFDSLRYISSVSMKHMILFETIQMKCYLQKIKEKHLFNSTIQEKLVKSRALVSVHSQLSSCLSILMVECSDLNADTEKYLEDILRFISCFILYKVDSVSPLIWTEVFLTARCSDNSVSPKLDQILRKQDLQHGIQIRNNKFWLELVSIEQVEESDAYLYRDHLTKQECVSLKIDVRFVKYGLSITAKLGCTLVIKVYSSMGQECILLEERLLTLVKGNNSFDFWLNKTMKSCTIKLVFEFLNGMKHIPKLGVVIKDLYFFYSGSLHWNQDIQSKTIEARQYVLHNSEALFEITLLSIEKNFGRIFGAVFNKDMTQFILQIFSVLYKILFYVHGTLKHRVNDTLNSFLVQLQLYWKEENVCNNELYREILSIYSDMLQVLLTYRKQVVNNDLLSLLLAKHVTGKVNKDSVKKLLETSDMVKNYETELSLEKILHLRDQSQSFVTAYGSSKKVKPSSLPRLVKLQVRDFVDREQDRNFNLGVFKTIYRKKRHRFLSDLIDSNISAFCTKMFSMFNKRYCDQKLKLLKYFELNYNFNCWELAEETLQVKDFRVSKKLKRSVHGNKYVNYSMTSEEEVIPTMSTKNEVYDSVTRYALRRQMKAATDWINRPLSTIRCDKEFPWPDLSATKSLEENSENKHKLLVSGITGTLEEKVLLGIRAMKISKTYKILGRIIITTKAIYFDPDPADNIRDLYYKTKKKRSKQEKNFIEEKEPRREVFSIKQIKKIYLRRHYLCDSALEIFSSQSSWLLDFGSYAESIKEMLTAEKNRTKVVTCLWSLLEYDVRHSSLKEKFDPVDKLYQEEMTAALAPVIKAWKNGALSNFDYLMHLNRLAGRSEHLLDQYPVFPWVIQNYESEAIDLSDERFYRDLSKPVGALEQNRLQDYIERYNTLDEADMPKFHYGSHFSTRGGVVLYFLVRLEPFTSLHVDLQDGHFDYPDRLFNSIKDTYDMCLSHISEVKELIPEFYYLPSFLINHNSYSFGLKQDGVEADDVVLPKYANNAENFVNIMRQALESDIVSKNLHKWVNLIFGFKRQGKAAIDATNIFYYLTYPENINLKQIESDSLDTVMAQVSNFGVCPNQIFFGESPERKTSFPFQVDVLESVIVAAKNVYHQLQGPTLKIQSSLGKNLVINTGLSGYMFAQSTFKYVYVIEKNIIKVYEIFENTYCSWTPVFCLKGHLRNVNFIHETSDEEFLISKSSDFTLVHCLSKGCLYDSLQNLHRVVVYNKQVKSFNAG